MSARPLLIVALVASACGGAPVREHSAIAVAPAHNAFRDGGIPRHDLAFERLVDALPRLMWGPHPELPDLPLPKVAVPNTTGTPLARVVPAFYAAAQRWIDATTDSRERYDETKRAAAELNTAIANAGLGYYLWIELGTEDGPSMTMKPYLVERVAMIEVDGVRRGVLGLRSMTRYLELDELGATRGSVPLVLLDNTDGTSAVELAPVLAANEPFPLAATILREDRQRELAAATGASIRRDLLRALGSDGRAAARIGDLLAQRAHIMAAWPPIGDMWIVEDLRRALFLPVKLVALANDSRIAAIEQSLARSDAKRIVGRIAQLVARATAVHEAQHVVEAERTPPRQPPPQLVDALGPLVDNAVAQTAYRELPAYLSSLAHEQALPHFVLWSVIYHAFAASEPWDGEAYAAAFIVEQMARHLGARVDRPLVNAGVIDLERLLDLAILIGSRSGKDLNAAAAAAWVAIYGEPVTTIAMPAPGPGR